MEALCSILGSIFRILELVYDLVNFPNIKDDETSTSGRKLFSSPLKKRLEKIFSVRLVV